MKINQPGSRFTRAIDHPHNEEPKDVDVPPYVVVIGAEDHSISDTFADRLGEAYRAQDDYIIDSRGDSSHTFQFRSAVSAWNFARKAITIAEEMGIVDFSVGVSTAPIN